VTYLEAVEWLFVQTRAGAPRGLSRIQKLLEHLGRPEQNFPAIHVIGTNGKGGVVAYLEAAFKASGERYGATTSPHLVDFRERIRTYRGLISEAEVIHFAQWAKNKSFAEPIAFFDYTTAMAFEHFAQLGVKIAAVEAGVGGLLDDTNILPKVRLTILTSLGQDHLDVLGGSLEAVAKDKAGAIRPGVPVVSGFAGIGQKVVRQIAAERHAPLFELDSPDPLFGLLVEPVLKGAVQRQNARLAAAALRLLGYSEADISTGLSTAVHPGRMQEVDWQGVRVVLDGAHNPPAAQALAQEFERYHLVFGGFPRKDYHAVLGHLLPKAISVRYARAGKGALQAEDLQAERYAPYLEPFAALQEAMEQAKQDGEGVLVTGSLYLVGEILSALPLDWPAKGPRI